MSKNMQSDPYFTSRPAEMNKGRKTSDKIISQSFCARG